MEAARQAVSNQPLAKEQRSMFDVSVLIGAFSHRLLAQDTSRTNTYCYILPGREIERRLATPGDIVSLASRHRGRES